MARQTAASTPARKPSPRKPAGAAKPAARPRRKATPRAAAAPPAIRIRMYRLGVGDCFLLRLPRQDGTPFHLLIDCGIHMAEPDGGQRIRAVAEDIRAECGGRLDLVVGTHEHWDHLSGFFHAREVFAQCSAGALWCAWTENPRDPVARTLLGLRDKGVAALWEAVRRAAAAPEGTRRDWDGILGFFGDQPGTGTRAKAAAEAMRALVATDAQILYREPGEAPFDGVSDAWRLFVLGPPRDPAALRHAAPRGGTGEAYPFDGASLAATEMAAASLAATVGEANDPPFDRRYAMPLEDSRIDPFFRDRYWEPVSPHAAPPEEERGQAWRQVGPAWLEGAEALALRLDKMTNNTSLVLALEIGPAAARDNPVVLFAADAQIGNWLSWKDVRWPDYHGRPVDGADLLRRTVVYKVGHHASHNATPMEGGLEAMDRLRLALVPTSAAMASKVGWGTLPWPNLLAALARRTGDRVLRSDEGASPGTQSIPGISVTAGDAWFDITLPLDLPLNP